MDIFRKAFPEKNIIFTFVVILLIGAILRFYNLDRESLWTDELASWKISSHNKVSDMFTEIIEEDTYPPGYYLLLHYIIKYVGDSELILRLPSAIGGLLSIIAIYFFGIRLYTYKEGLISAGLLAILYTPIYYSQEARAYCFLILFSILSTYSWIAIIKSLARNNPPKRQNIFWYVLFSTINSYLHYFGVYLVFLQGIYLIAVLFKFKLARKYFFVIYSLIVLAYCPWLPSMWEHAGSDFTPLKAATICFFVKYTGSIFNASKGSLISLTTYSMMDKIISVAIILMVYSLILSLFTRRIIILLKSKESKKFGDILLNNDILLFFWFISPFIGIFILYKLSFGYYSYRYLLISLPAAYLLVARSITQLFRAKKIQIFASTVMLLLFAFLLIFYQKYYTQTHKEQYREAATYVIQKDKLYFESEVICYGYDKLLDYYFLKNNFKKKISLYFVHDIDRNNVLQKLKKLDSKYLWLICAHHGLEKVYLNQLIVNYELIDIKRFLGTSVMLFKKIEK